MSGRLSTILRPRGSASRGAAGRGGPGRLDRALTFGGTEERPSRVRRLLGMSLGLVYLVYPLTEILNGTLTGALAVFAVVTLVTFTGSFVATALSPTMTDIKPRSTYTFLTVTTVIALFAPLIFGPGWLAMPIYLTVLYGFALPPRFSMLALAALAGWVILIGTLQHADGGTLSLLILQIFSLGFLFISVRNTRMLVVELRKTQAEATRLAATEAATEERLRISRDLHDLLGHSLSLIVLKSELAGRLAEGRAAAEIADIEQVARQALVEVRDAVTGYRQRGLSGELDGARVALSAAGVAVTVHTTGTPLPDYLDGLFGWAVREGATNVLRHARATRCAIDITYTATRATLDLTDNGPPATPAARLVADPAAPAANPAVPPISPPAAPTAAPLTGPAAPPTANPAARSAAPTVPAARSAAPAAPAARSAAPTAPAAASLTGPAAPPTANPAAPPISPPTAPTARPPGAPSAAPAARSAADPAAPISPPPGPAAAHTRSSDPAGPSDPAREATPPGAFATAPRFGGMGLRGPGSGLEGLAERVQAVGGTVDAGPAPGGGFRLHIEVPVPAAAPTPAPTPASAHAPAPAPAAVRAPVIPE
ncbi:hypothetical protein J5X84_21620 [Streptosporangiaceae bacterium NEAU-GS5]|nr:hypothetical protein [Streptosporangiaceae bacterium NEAU-GS5]